MVVADYLTATRRSCGKQGTPEHLAFYGRQFALLKEVGRDELRDVATPDLLVVYSMQRYTETVVLGETYTVVYDQYLNQSFNMLNRILVHSNRPRELLIYAHKCLAEELLIRSKLDHAFLFAMMHAQRKSDIDLPRSDRDARHGMLTMIQETFMLAHEFSHLLMAANSDFRSRMLEYGTTLFNEYRGTLTPITAALAERHANDYTHEIVCDKYALDITLAWYFAQGFTAEDITGAIIIGMRHLQTLRRFATLADRIATGRELNPYSRHVLITQMREELLNAIVAADDYDRFPVAGVHNGPHDFTALTGRFDEVFEAPLYEDVIESIRRACEKLPEILGGQDVVMPTSVKIEMTEICTSWRAIDD